MTPSVDQWASFGKEAWTSREYREGLGATVGEITLKSRCVGVVLAN
jgi:hypothetical protein